MTAGSMPGPEVRSGSQVLKSGPEVDADVQTGSPAGVQTGRSAVVQTDLAGFMFLPLLTNFSKGQLNKSDRQK